MKRTTRRSWLMNSMVMPMLGLHRRASGSAPAPAPRRRAPRPARRRRSAPVRWPSRGRWRSAGAGRRRIRAGSGPAPRAAGRPRRAGCRRGSGAVVGRADAMHHLRLDQGLGHGHPRVERAERILEDHLHLPALPAQGLAAQSHADRTVEADRAGGRLDQPQHQPGDGGLAGTGFADQAEALAARQRERGIADGADLAEGLRQALGDREAARSSRPAPPGASSAPRCGR